MTDEQKAEYLEKQRAAQQQKKADLVSENQLHVERVGKGGMPD